MGNKVFGTKEWASHSYNCVTGCSHECRYCFARHDAINKFSTVKDGEWGDEIINWDNVQKIFTKREGVTMFPTQHDITPKTLDACVITLKNLLEPGNNVLIVSKPHLECIKVLCEELKQYKEQVLFRFTIGASDDKILQYWEPKAPKYQERFDSLKYAFESKFATSISMEPCLDWEKVIINFLTFAPYVTNSIWIGAMNFVDQRVQIKTEEDKSRVDILKSFQTIGVYEQIYEVLKNHPLIKWKESIKSALGLEMPETIGLDI